MNIPGLSPAPRTPVEPAQGGSPGWETDQENAVARPVADDRGGGVRHLRILYVTTLYLPFAGGIETHVREVARRAAAAGHTVTILTTDPDGILPARERSDGLEIVRVRSWPRGRDYYFAPGVYPVVAGGGWDIVHCQGYHNFVPPTAMLAAARSHVPYVVTFHSGGHSSRLRHALRGAQRALLRPLLARAERLIAVSTFEAGLFRSSLRLPPQAFSVISNGSDLPQMQDTPEEINRGDLIVSVGRLERYKGHHRVIEALPRVAQVLPDVRLRIVGAGPYLPALERLAIDLGVHDRVEIGGIDPNDRAGLSRALLQASLVTLLSDYEAQPLAVMEALSLRRPVLVTYTTGLAELADRGLVRAVSAGSQVEEVAEAILYSLAHPLVPPRVALRTWDECARDLLALYQAIVRANQCAS